MHGPLTVVLTMLEPRDTPGDCSFATLVPLGRSQDFACSEAGRVRAAQNTWAPRESSLDWAWWRRCPCLGMMRTTLMEGTSDGVWPGTQRWARASGVSKRSWCGHVARCSWPKGPTASCEGLKWASCPVERLPGSYLGSCCLCS